MTDDGCLIRPDRQKTAGITVYLVEELGDARMRCDQLVRYVTEATRMIERSPQRDKLFEVAGHLIHAVPTTLFKLQKALQAVALAANRIDYEEIKMDLRPEKVRQLEDVLEDVRIRQIQRYSEPLMTPQQVAAKLRQIAATTRKSQLPQDEVVQLITALERNPEVSDDERVMTADMLDELANLLVEASVEGQSEKAAAKWIQKVIKDPGALRRHFGTPEGETIPTEKIKGELAKLKKKEDKTDAEKKLVKQLNLALTLRGPKVPPPKGKKKAQDEVPAWLQVAAVLRGMIEGSPAEPFRPTAVDWKIDAGDKQAIPPGIAGVAPRGKTQKAIMEYLGRAEGKKIVLTDMTRHPSFRGVDFGQIMRSAESLKKQGLIEYDGKTLRKTAGASATLADDDDKQGRHEEGEEMTMEEVMKGMSEEEKAKWQEQHKKHKDKFKKDAKADISVELGYDALNIFQRYWEGQGDLLYAMLSRRGTSVSIVELDVSRRELERFEDVAKEIVKDSDDASEVRVAKAYLKKIPAWKRGKKSAADWKLAVKLPSEDEDGKPGYDDDFRAGYAAGKKAYKADDTVDASDAKSAYKRVSRKHGSWWVDGYTAAIDVARGAYATSGAQIAKKLRLAADRSAVDWKVTAADAKAALLALYKWATTGSRSGNPYSKPEVRAAIRALGGDPKGYDLPEKRPSGKIPGALYDLTKWATTGERSGNPHSKPEVKAANRALGGDGFDLPEDGKKAAEAWKVTAALKPVDKKVIEAFADKKKADGKLLSTDGKKLDKAGMGGGMFAEWKGDKVHVAPGRPMVKNDEPILRYMKKAIPKNDLADHPSFRAASDDEDKQSRHEEGKKMTPEEVTEGMSEAEAKEWKANTEKHKDKFKKEGVSQMVPGKWYHQVFRNGDTIYFTPLEQQKNRGFKGLQVDLYVDTGRPKKAKQTSVVPSNFGLWTEIPERDVPKNVMGKFKARMASEWKAGKAKPGMGGLPPGIADDEDKQSRHEEGKSMTMEEVTKGMSEEEKAKWKAEHAKHKEKFKKKDAGTETIKIRRQSDGAFLVEQGFDEKPIADIRDVMVEVGGRLRRKPKTIVMTDKYSLGPNTPADPYSGPTYAIKDRRGSNVMEGYDSHSLWVSYGPSMIWGRAIRAAADWKLSRYEKDEDADKDDDGAPDNLKGEAEEKWKANTEKYKDKFEKKEAARGA